MSKPDIIQPWFATLAIWHFGSVAKSNGTRKMNERLAIMKRRHWSTNPIVRLGNCQLFNKFSCRQYKQKQVTSYLLMGHLKRIARQKLTLHFCTARHSRY